MTTRSVKWFNPVKDCGFIEPDDGSKHAFVRISAEERTQMSNPRAGQAIRCDFLAGRNGKSSAENPVDLG